MVVCSLVSLWDAMSTLSLGCTWRRLSPAGVAHVRLTFARSFDSAWGSIHKIPHIYAVTDKADLF